MKKFLKDESGATAIEYALIAAFMGVMLIVAVPILSSAISGKFGVLATAITNAK
jgi:pilus assembly protein Flp/PilA